MFWEVFTDAPDFWVSDFLPLNWIVSAWEISGELAKKNKLSKTIFPQGHNPLLYVSKNILSISELPLTANACFFKPPVSELSFTFLALKLLALKYKWMYYLSMLKEEKSKVFKLSKKKKKFLNDPICNMN